MRVLVADDDPTYRALLDGLLKEWGFDASFACNGREALDILGGQDAPTLAIADWMMPEMDGYELCRRLRERDSHRPYILLMTGNSRRDDLLTIVLAGADDYILKPFEPLDLKIRLRLAVRVLASESELAMAGREEVGRPSGP